MPVSAAVGWRFAGVYMRTSMRVDTNVDIPMRDGILLRADIYRPSNRQKTPAILFRTGYNKSGRASVAGDFLPMLQAMAGGYAFVVQDLRGRFASQGEWVRDSADPYGALPMCTPMVARTMWLMESSERATGSQWFPLRPLNPAASNTTEFTCGIRQWCFARVIGCGSS